MGVVIKRNVILRSIVTEQLKKQLEQELQRNIDEIDQQIRQIDFRTQPYITELQRSNIQQAMAVRGQIEQEKGAAAQCPRSAAGADEAGRGVGSG